MTAQSSQQWDAYAQQTGNPDMVGRFADREAVIAPYIGLKEVLDRQAPMPDNTPAGIRSLDIRAERAGLVPGSPSISSL